MIGLIRHSRQRKAQVRSYFRGVNALASLKLGLEKIAHHILSHFRGVPAPASLKLLNVRNTVFGICIFPGRPRPALIEAYRNFIYI